MKAKRGWKIARLSLLLVVFVMAMSLICQAATITGFAVKKMPAEERVEIHVNANGPVNYRVLSKSKPKQALVVEMYNASVVGKSQKVLPINVGIVERAKMKRSGAGIVRLTVDVLQPVRYNVQAVPGGGYVLIMGTQTVAAKATKAAAVKVSKVSKSSKKSVKVSKKVSKKVVKVSSIKVARRVPKAVSVAMSKKPYSHKYVAFKKKVKKTKKAKKIYIKPVKMVSIDFVNADLIYVLKLLSKELGVNLVTDSSVTGSVTMSLKNVSAQTAINIIVRMNGFKMKKMGNIMFIGSTETINAITPDVIAYQPTGYVKVMAIKLAHITAQDAIQTIKSTYPMVQASAPRSNVVVITANPKMLVQIKELVKGVDIEKVTITTPVQQEKTEVVRLKYAKAKEILTTLKNLLGSDAPANMEVDDRLNAIIFKGYESQIEKAKNQLEEVDIPLQQVMLSVKVVDLSETGAKNLGVNWQVGASDGTQPIRWYENPDGYVNPNPFQAPTQATAAPMPMGFFVRNPFVLQSTLSLQVTQGDAKVLASPRVAALSGKEAMIHIGDKYPIVYYDPRAGQYQVIYVDIGIKLTVKPTISPDGYITTDIDTTVSDLRELINNQYPRTTERTAKLTIRVKDNNTIVIGGMVNESSRTSITKVPLLGDIPVIGNLFKSNSTDKSKGEVVIMITPKIITQ